MALDEDQRAWLDTAVQAKGRFTRKKAVEQDWENYRRRRAKAATLLEGMPTDSPMRSTVANGLAAADVMAKAGKFADAYKSLSTVKAQAKAGVGSKAGPIAFNALNGTAAVIDVKLNSLEGTADFCVSHFDSLVRRVEGMTACSEHPDVGAASVYLANFVRQVEPLLRADLANCQDWINRTSADVIKRDVKSAIAAAEIEVKTFEQAGLGAAIRVPADRIAAIKLRSVAQGGRYLDATVLTDFGAAKTKLVLARIATIKAMSSFQVREGNSGAPDAVTQLARHGLTPTINAIMADMDDFIRVGGAQTALRKAGLKDAGALTDTGRGPINPVPELPQFDPGLVFDDGILDDDEELPDDITADQADVVIDKAATKMRLVVGALDPNDPALTDLILKGKAELARICSQALTGIDSPNGLSQSHAACFARMAGALMEVIATASPNKMADDKASIMVGGVKYDVQGQLGKSKATVRRYVDPITGKAIAVKSVENGEQRDALAGEMRTHLRLMNANPDDPGAENLLKMESAAVGADGSLHMIMEVVEGGDVEKTSVNLRLMEESGLLPREARDALTVDIIRQTVMGMKAMEARGLVHNDMKGANLMLTQDGTVKIMDFGESRISDAKGDAPSAATAGFGTTGAYGAPEQNKKGTVTSKVDSYALGGMIKVLGIDVDDNQGLMSDKQAPVGALGRLAEALRETDPNKRPSLDAVLMSSYLTSGQEEHSPEDVADLKAASLQLSMAMGSSKAAISVQEFKDNKQGYLSTAWRPYELPDYSCCGDIPIGVLKTQTLTIDEKLRRLRMEKDQGAVKAQIDDLMRKRKFWEGKIGAAVDATRQSGKKELDDLAAHATKTINVPGKGGGNLSVKDALAMRKQLQLNIKNLQDKFYLTLADDPAGAGAKIVQVNQFLNDMDAQVKAIDAGIVKHLGPDGKFYLAELKLVGVSARFAPRNINAEVFKARATA